MLKTTLKRFCVVVVFGIAFAYIEAAVVVYLRTIIYGEPFMLPFPLTEFLTPSLFLTEVGREAATLLLMFTAAWLFGRNLQQRFAFFLTIFAVWDIFYYVWLKVLADWPGSIMDWDILFLIPMAWAGPVLAPVIISLTLFIFAAIILYRSSCARHIRPTPAGWFCFILAAVVVVASFCIAGLHIAEPDFRPYFYWPLFAVGYISAVALFLKCLLKSK
ncbi:MAG: hypothetical protein ACYSSO_09495 [Planctomycetota bacterium]